MKKATAIITPQNISIWYDKQAYVAGRSHKNFDKIVETFKHGNHADLPDLFDISKSINNRFLNTNVEIKNGLVYVEGEPAGHSALTKRIVENYEKGIEVDGLVNFISLLWRNPSPRVRGQLFNYLERYNMPICDDGWLIGFKAVNSDLTAIADNSFQYVLGKEARVSESRPENADPTSACHAGFLHLGSYSYVSSYGSANDKVFLLIRVSPEDIISVPSNEYSCNYEKICAWKMTPTAIVPREEFKEADSNYVSDSYIAKYIPENFHNKRDKFGRFIKKNSPKRGAGGKFIKSK
jgi:hypothetical protein